MKHSLLALLAVALTGCSTLNSYGVGGEPRIACYTRDNTAILDDHVVGSDSVHASVVRRITDADALCKKELPPKQEPAPKPKEPILYG